MAQYYCIMLRITTRCNATCDYCSTDTRDGTLMSMSDLSESCDSLKLYMNSLGLDFGSTQITMCLLGGELSTLSLEHLKKVKELILQKFNNFKTIEVGLQTNLIMSGQKAIDIYDLFNGNIGTSVDNFSSARKFKGSSEQYREIYSSNYELIKNERKANIGVCYVAGKNSEHTLAEYNLAKKNQYPIKLIAARQNYVGQHELKAEKDREELLHTFLQIFDDWFLKSASVVDPFMYMVKKKISVIEGGANESFESCNFTDKCHKQGVCIEPNGDYYFCQELADLKTLRIGNLITGEYDPSVVGVSEFRSGNIMAACSSCPHYMACRGGCMAYSIDADLGFYSKDPYCKFYTYIFNKIDDGINKFGIQKVKEWLNSIS